MAATTATDAGPPHLALHLRESSSGTRITKPKPRKAVVAYEGRYGIQNARCPVGRWFPGDRRGSWMGRPAPRGFEGPVAGRRNGHLRATLPLLGGRHASDGRWDGSTRPSTDWKGISCPPPPAALRASLRYAPAESARGLDPGGRRCAFWFPRWRWPRWRRSLRRLRRCRRVMLSSSSMSQGACGTRSPRSARTSH